MSVSPSTLTEEGTGDRGEAWGETGYKRQTATAVENRASRMGGNEKKKEMVKYSVRVSAGGTRVGHRG